MPSATTKEVGTPSSATTASPATSTSLLLQLTADLHTTSNTTTSTRDVLDDIQQSTPITSNQLQVSFSNVCYSVRTAMRPRTMVLQDVHGAIAPCQLLAIMGPSGSGKTTLLNILAGFHQPSRGTVLYNSATAQQHGRHYLAHAVGYVQQHPALLDTLTVQEMLSYTAGLTSAAKPLHARQAALSMVPQLLDLLGLSACTDTPCRRISGGEAKRVAIGVALLAGPKLLLLDEPLSGLDSAAAREVTQLLGKLSTHGMAVAASVHQPSNALFSEFVTLLVLARGRVVFSGPQVAAVPYFSRQATRVWKLGAVMPCHPGLDNNAEWLLGVIDALKDRVEVMVESFQRSSLYFGGDKGAVVVGEEVKGGDVPIAVMVVGDGGGDGVVAHDDQQHSSGVHSDGDVGGAWCVHGIITHMLLVWWAAWAASMRRLMVLLRYRALANLKSPAYWLSRGSNMLATAVILASTFWGVGALTSFDKSFNVLSCLFMLVFAPATVCLAQVSTIYRERAVYAREYADGLYTPHELLVALALADNTVITIASVISTAILYACVRLQGQYMLLFTSTWMTLLAGTNLALAAMAWCRSMDVVHAVLPTYAGISTLFAGFTIPRIEDVPVWWRWFVHVNWLAYAWQAQVVNVFGGGDAQEGGGGNGAGLLVGGLPLATSQGGEVVLRVFGLSGMVAWQRVALQAVFVPVFGLLAWAGLAWGVVRRR